MLRMFDVSRKMGPSAWVTFGHSYQPINPEARSRAGSTFS